MKKISRALISVSDKTGIIEFARGLIAQEVDILSTGGTAKLLAAEGIKVKEVSDHTGFPEMLDGRVKTLHPKVHGGILGVRGNKAHKAAMDAHDIVPIDLVVIDLYPFEATVAKGASFEECIENIDIGGPAMIRSAAKNHDDVVVIVDPIDYARVAEAVKMGGTELALRRELAAKAYARTAAYDGAISMWFAHQRGEKFPPTIVFSARLKQSLRYGENPHQEAAFYTVKEAPPGVATATQVRGKELSFNNINDTDAAFTLVSEFKEPAVAIIKHANPCGVARATNVSEAYKKAYACDTVSAFGGIVALNRTLDAATMEEIAKIFVEVIIAPDADAKALEILEQKKNLRLLLTGKMPAIAYSGLVSKAVHGGVLLQDADIIVADEKAIKCVTKKAPTAEQMKDLLFAFTVCKHVKSNAIVMAKDLATIGIGAGQMSRVNSVRIACIKAEEAGLTTQGAVLASDAFFPFADNIELAAAAGISAIIQPGGSVRDEEVIAAADKHGIAMVMTGIRHFLH